MISDGKGNEFQKVIMEMDKPPPNSSPNAKTPTDDPESITDSNVNEVEFSTNVSDVNLTSSNEHLGHIEGLENVDPNKSNHSHDSDKKYKRRVLQNSRYT